jgi:hypothetical protein
MVEVLCESCDRILTRPLRLGEARELRRTVEDGGDPLVDEGVAVVDDQQTTVTVYKADEPPTEQVFRPAGGIVINPADVLEGVLVSVGQDSGCCGSDGLDGPNRACLCSRIVGTARTDCWTSSEIHFLPGAVRLG